jgi:hypothetical protein
MCSGKFQYGKRMINMLMSRLKTSSKRRHYIFGMLSLIAAGIALLFALEVSPWIYAMNVRVRLHMQAPAETKIEVCWDKTQLQCLPLVPYLSTEKRIAEIGEIADVWLGEIPSRPTYSVSLIFKSSITRGMFQRLELDSANLKLWGFIPGVGVQNTRVGLDQLERQGVTYSFENGTYYIDSKPGDLLITSRDIKAGPSEADTSAMPVMVWTLLFSIYLLVAIPLYLLPSVVQNLGTATKHVNPSPYSWWIYMLCGGLILCMLLLIVNSPVQFNAYDSMYYMHHATIGTWFSSARPSGYWIFLGLALRIFRYNLEVVVLLQAIFLAFSTQLCIWALRKWLHPFLAVLVVAGILFSPAQVHWVLSIMRESLFSSLRVARSYSGYCSLYCQP